jgi:AcrR family transcriptional regulator
MNKKPYQGQVNDKERSKQKLIEAVGIVIREKGYTGLTATNISRAAGLDRRLITLYFGSLNTLIETYVRSNDYWIATSNEDVVGKDSKPTCTKEMLNSLLQNQLDDFLQDDEMQKMILWQISQSTQLMKEVSQEREKVSHQFFALADQELKGKDIDLRAIAALLVAGVYYLVLYSKTTDCQFCEIDMNTPAGMERVKKAMTAILDNVYASK